MKVLIRVLGVVLFVAVTAGCSVTGGYRGEPMCQGKALSDHRIDDKVMSDRVPVPYCSWIPKTSHPRGIAIVSPGFDESAREMHFLGSFLRERNYAVYACDLRGQGDDRNPSRLGSFSDWNRWVADLQELSAMAARRYPHTPIVYFGQSTGALIALNAASRMRGENAPRAIVLQCPAVLFVLPPSYVPPVLLTGQIVRFNQWRGTMPGLLALKKLSIMQNSGDEAAWERSRDRVCPGFTFKSIRSCYALGADTGRRLATIQEPVLIQYGSKDPLFDLTADPQKSPGQFLSMIGSPDKQATWIANGQHDMLNDRAHRQQLLAQLEFWLSCHGR